MKWGLCLKWQVNVGARVSDSDIQQDMPFIEQAQLGSSARWRYLISFPLIFALWLVFVNIISFIAGIAIGFYWGGDGSDIIGYLSQEYPDQDSTWYVVQYVLMMLSIILFLPANLLVVSLVHRRKWRTLLHVDKRINWRGFRTSLAVSLFLLSALVTVIVMDGEGQFSPSFDLKVWIVVVLLSCVLIPLQILAEEVFFRGYLMQAVAHFTPSFWWRWLIPAFAFGALHFYNDGVMEAGRWAMVYYIFLSLYLGLLVFRGDGLEYSAGFHLSTNIIAILVITTPNLSLGTPTLIEAPDSVWGARELLFGLGYFALHYALVFSWMRLRHGERPHWRRQPA